MANLSVFSFESHEIRFVGTADEPWWVAVDVCKVLELDDTSKAVSRLDDDEKLIRTLLLSGQRRESLLVNESGLYSLVLTSRKAQAKRFKKWLTSEVIPAIRKTGTYSVIAKPQPLLPSEEQQAKLAKHHEKVESIRQRIATTEQALAELEAELLTAMRDEVNEAKAFTSAYADVGEEYVRCTEVLSKAKALNPYLNVGSPKSGK
ncbi:hypothetical protein IQ229_21695 [Nostoc cf. edaphicum LEGE 07299]|uniref:Bro-N domain-containing protein n=1 Tax=Nostoc cf. edaphicum LEGE 07299 TaxID=2777974 RepID=A0ABR9U5S7_9NOSO|nr:BRO family protein [Nostoc edaphicum]MBE9107447.1 hypothetical protein [Nostoc cf. edaphicum LEGE 07299]